MYLIDEGWPDPVLPREHDVNVGVVGPLPDQPEGDVLVEEAAGRGGQREVAAQQQVLLDINTEL